VDGRSTPVQGLGGIMNRVYLGVYVLGTLLVWEALHKYGQEKKRQLEEKLGRSVKEFVESFHIVIDAFAQLGVTAEEVARQLEAYSQLMGDGVSWHTHTYVSAEARQMLERRAFEHYTWEHAPEEVYLDLCWRCETELTEAEMDFGLCEVCRQELEDL
jgi:hypothetical protein